MCLFSENKYDDDDDDDGNFEGKLLPITGKKTDELPNCT